MVELSCLSAATATITAIGVVVLLVVTVVKGDEFPFLWQQRLR